jgi:hypothetical protein
VIDALRKTHSVANKVTEVLHAAGKQQAAQIASADMERKHELKRDGDMAVLSVGLSDVKGILEPAIKKALSE